MPMICVYEFSFPFLVAFKLLVHNSIQSFLTTISRFSDIFLYCLRGQSNFALSNLRQIFVVSKMIQIICTRCESGLPFAVLQNVAYVNKQNSSVYHQ